MFRDTPQPRGFGNNLALLLGVAIVLSLLCHASVAHAETGERATCVGAYETAQVLRIDSQLRAARDQALACAQPACGSFIQKECTAWLEELQRDIPSAVFTARAPEGTELFDVKVVMDGQPLTSRLDGRAVQLDPGIHEFSFESADGLSAQQRISIQQGKKNQLISIMLEPPAARPTAATPGAEQAQSQPPQPQVQSSSSSSTKIAYFAAGVGVVGVGGFAVLATMARNEHSQLPECWPECEKSRIDDIRTKYILADISLGVGIVSLGTAAWLFLSNSDAPAPSEEEHKSGDYVLDVRPARGGIQAEFRGVF